MYLILFGSLYIYTYLCVYLMLFWVEAGVDHVSDSAVKNNMQ